MVYRPYTQLFLIGITLGSDPMKYLDIKRNLGIRALTSPMIKVLFA